MSSQVHFQFPDIDAFPVILTMPRLPVHCDGVKVGDIHIPPTSRAHCDGVQIGPIGADLAVISVLKLATSLFAKYGS